MLINFCRSDEVFSQIHEQLLSVYYLKPVHGTEIRFLSPMAIMPSVSKSPPPKIEKIEFNLLVHGVMLVKSFSPTLTKACTLEEWVRVTGVRPANLVE